MSSLFVLTTQDTWREIKLTPDDKRYDTYCRIRDILNDRKEITCEIRLNGIRTKILFMDIHHGCSVAFCEQEDSKTYDLRYIVYGTKYHSHYGIGVTLNDVTIHNSLRHCPVYITAHYIK